MLSTPQSWRCRFCMRVLILTLVLLSIPTIYLAQEPPATEVTPEVTVEAAPSEVPATPLPTQEPTTAPTSVPATAADAVDTSIPTEVPADTQTQAPTDAPTSISEPPATTPADQSTEPPTGSTPEVTDNPTQPPTMAAPELTEEPTQPPTVAAPEVTEEPMQPPTEAAPEVTEEPMQPPTEEAAPEVTEEPTQPPTEEPISIGPLAVQTYCKLLIDDKGDDDPYTYTFSAQSNKIATFAWDLGDGTTIPAGTQQSVDHVYATENSFVITLACQPEPGYGSLITLNGRVTVISNPVANFVLSPAGPVIIDLVPLSVSAVSTSSGGSLTLSWTITDDASPTPNELSTGSGESISYTFTDYGTYWFNLKAEDRWGNFATVSKSITITAPQPSARFSMEPSDGVSPLTVEVLEEDLLTGPITTWEWDFGDGSSAVTGAGPHQHTYDIITLGLDPSVEHLFWITLTYTGPGGSGTFQRQVGVYPHAVKVVSSFTWELSPQSSGDRRVCFTNTSTGPYIKSEWDFDGDGTAYTYIENNAAVVCNTYSTDGLRTVRLRVSDGGSPARTSTSSQAISVVASPTADFSISPGSNITWGTLIDFDGTLSSGTITSYAWDFDGDGNTDSTNSKPSGISLTQLGNNPIRLTVTGPGGTATAEKIVFVARLDITCDITGDFDVLPSESGDKSYDSTITNDAGRTVSYQWSVTGGTPLPSIVGGDTSASFVLNWGTSAGTYQINLTASTPDGAECSASKTITRSWKPLDCKMNVSPALPSPTYPDGTNYSFSANILNVDGRSISGYKWYVNGTEQAGQTGSSFSRSWTSVTSETIRYEVIVDNGDSTTSSCYEDKNVTITDWPATLTCTSITSSSGGAAPIALNNNGTLRQYTYTANVSDSAGRTLSYNWTVPGANIVSQSGNKITVSWPGSEASLPPGSDKNITVSVTASPAGPTATCNLNFTASVTYNSLRCNVPTGDFDPVVGETVSYNRSVSNIYGRSWASPSTTWQIQRFNTGTSSWESLPDSTSHPLSLNFPTAGEKYQIRYQSSVQAGNGLPADTCAWSDWKEITVSGPEENFFCDSFPDSGNNFNITSGSSSVFYPFVVNIDNGNNIDLHYTWVLVGPGSDERIIGTNTSSANGLVSNSPGFTGLSLGPIGNYTIRTDVRAVNNTDSLAPGYSSYECSLSHSLNVGTLNASYTYGASGGGSIDKAKVAVGQQICFTNTSTWSHDPVDFTWTISGDPSYNSLGMSTVSDQNLPGCISFSEPGSYDVDLLVSNRYTDSGGAEQLSFRKSSLYDSITFSVWGLQSIAIQRSNHDFAPNTLTFTAMGTNITSNYTWKFFNTATSAQVGSTKTSASPVTQYFGSAGTYRAEVSGTGPLGTTTAQIEFTLLSSDSLLAAFTPSVYGGIAPMKVCFTDNSQGLNIQNWIWDFGNGDGITYDKDNIPGSICTTYVDPAQVYSASLEITNGILTETATNPVRTYNLLESRATFSITPKGGAQYCFKANLEGGVSVTGWEYGDNNTGVAVNETCHTYVASGTYVVQMNIENTGGDTGTVVRTVTVDLTASTNPVLGASGSCSAVRTASFTVENTGDPMKSPDMVIIKDANGNTLFVDEIQLGSNQSKDYSLTDQTGLISLRMTDHSTITAAANCDSGPALDVVAQCQTDQLPAFVVSNSDGPMATAQNYEIRDGLGNVLDSGSFQMARGDSALTFYVPSGSPADDTYRFVSTGSSASLDLSRNCYIAPTPTFTPTFTLTPTLTPSLTFTPSPTLEIFGDSATATPSPTLTPSATPEGVSVASASFGSSFTSEMVRSEGLSVDVLDLPQWSGVPSCGHSCPPFRLYHTDETGDWEIFRLDGADPETQTTFRENLSLGKGPEYTDMSPSLSPNNDWIVFASNRDGNWEIYLASTSGSEESVTRITHNTVAIDTDPVWGPNNYVVFESSRFGNWDLFMIDMTTGQEYRLTENGADDINPFWSPDGSKLVFQSNRTEPGEDRHWRLYEFDIATMTIRRITQGNEIEVDPQYNPNGGRIVYRSYTTASTNSVIQIVNLDGSGLTNVTTPAENATNAVWSPSGRYLAYQSDLDGDLDIYVFDAASGARRKITDNNIRDYAPSWLCGDDRLMFTSEIMGSPDIFEVNTLPLSAPPILLEQDGDQMTFDLWMDIYPQNTPSEENASREGETVLGTFGRQTAFLGPDTHQTPIDLSEDFSARQDWPDIGICPSS